MTDEEFRQWCMRVLAEHDARQAAHTASQADHTARMAAHEAYMADHTARLDRMDRDYAKLVQVQLDLARSHDEHEARMDRLQLTLEAIKDLLQQRN